MSVQDSMKVYMRDIGKIPLINTDEEKRLARLIEKGDRDALEALIKANLRLVVKIAHDFKGLGLPLAVLTVDDNLRGRLHFVHCRYFFHHDSICPSRWTRMSGGPQRLIPWLVFRG